MLRLLLLTILLLAPGLAYGETSAVRLISPELARRAGLERMWFTQLSLDRSRGRVSGLFMHVSPTQSHTVFQFTHDGKRHVFSQRDRDAFGKELGVEGAKKVAEKSAEEIKTELQKAG